MQYQKTIVWVLSGFLVCSTAVHADNYNFFFDEAKNKGKSQQEVAPAPETSPAPVQVETSSTPGAPIVIHNNVQMPQTQAPVSVAPQPGLAPSARMEATVVAPVQRHPVQRWKVGFGPMLSSVPYDFSYYDGSRYQYNTGRHDKPALLMSLGYRLGPAFAVNTMMGLHEGSGWNPVFVGDLELIPVRVDVGSFDLFEVAVLGGVSNILVASSSYGGIAPHIGARLNINLGRYVTLTTAMRFADKFRSAEWSLAFNI